MVPLDTTHFDEKITNKEVLFFVGYNLSVLQLLNLSNVDPNHRSESLNKLNDVFLVNVTQTTFAICITDLVGQKKPP